MSYYQDLLKLMGISFATEMVQQNKPSEVKLWRAVINNALGDISNNLSDRKSSIQKLNAHFWIVNNTEDFKNVCYYADLDPDNVRLQYIRAVKNKKIIFTDKQYKWKKYNDNYQLLKEEKDKEERRKIRKIVEYLRRLVFNASNKPIEI